MRSLLYDDNLQRGGINGGMSGNGVGGFILAFARTCGVAGGTEKGRWGRSACAHSSSHRYPAYSFIPP